MASLQETMRLAFQHKQAGRRKEAEAAWREVTLLDPGGAEAWNQLGLLAHESGEPARAARCLRRAVELDPHEAGYHYNLASFLRLEGSLEEAEQEFREALRRKPDYAPALAGLGGLLAGLGRHEEAAALLARAAELGDRTRETRFALAASLQELGRLREAAEVYRALLGEDPDCQAAHNNLGEILRRQGRFEEAVACFEQALRLAPESAETLGNFALTLASMACLDQADEFYRKALALRPDDPLLLLNLSSLRRMQGRYQECADLCRRIVETDPGNGQAWNNLAAALGHGAQAREALGYFRRAVELTGRPSTYSNLLLYLHYDFHDPEETFAEHRRFAARFEAPLKASWPRHDNDPSPGRRLRIGYVSPDFAQHSVAYFFGSLLAGHARPLYDIYCYSDTPRPDAITETLQRLAGRTRWRDARGWSDEELAAQIRADGIDILVDLAGHTANNRLLVFARKPAPVQVTYLGYPDTTGLESMDYRITDAWADPPGVSDARHTERLLRLPRCFLAYRPPADAPEVAPLPALARGYVTFGSFNNAAKASPAWIEACAKILERTPGSRLLLKAGALGPGNANGYLLERFARHGIPGSRLTLLPQSPSMHEHLRMYGEMDLALDPFPYNGTASTCEALWMGVPVVTLGGATHAARVGVSLLTQVGLQRFIVPDPEAYVETAARAAAGLEALSRLRADLRPRMARSPLTDTADLTRAIEHSYRQVWREWCARREQFPAPAPAPEPPLQPPGDRSTAGESRAAALRRRMESFPYWYHRIELPYGLVTPGWAPLSAEAYRVPADLTGKRVLDAGAWDGYWTFEALKRGASEAVAIDDFSDFLGQLQSGDRRAWETFDFCRDALGYGEDRCRRIEMPVYDVSPERLGRFDVVFCFGLLYHLRHPLLALDRLAAVTNELICVESAILDDFSPYRGGLGHGYPGGQMVAEFYPGSEYGGNPTNWWAPTLACLGAMVASAGFAGVETWKLAENPSALPLCRGFAQGRKR